MFGFIFFVCKQKTAYELRISDWSSDVCSSDLRRPRPCERPAGGQAAPQLCGRSRRSACHRWRAGSSSWALFPSLGAWLRRRLGPIRDSASLDPTEDRAGSQRSEEHTSELQSLMRISYAVFCLKKKTHEI